MHAEVVTHFLDIVLHNSAVDGVPESLVKNTQIPRLSLEIVMLHRGQKAEDEDICPNQNPEHFIFFPKFHDFIILYAIFGL